MSLEHAVDGNGNGTVLLGNNGHHCIGIFTDTDTSSVSHAKVTAEIGIAGLSLMVDACTANNTVAIVMAGPIAKEISEEFGVDAKRSASLLDIFTSVGQGLIPYEAQLLSAATLTALTPFDILPYCYYPILMAISALAFILLKKEKK